MTTFLSNLTLLGRLAVSARLVGIVSYSRIRSNYRKMENGEPTSKKKLLEIGTHDGTFHCDEALACYMLKLLPEYKDAKITRSRNMDILNKCDIVVDVGGIYDKNNSRYDHHQRSFEETLSTVVPSVNGTHNIKLSSAGLIYAHFGEQVIRQVTDLSDNAIKAVYEKIYESFIQEIDAIDNGVPICEGEQKYRIATNISSRVGFLNPAWNATSSKSINELFEEAMELVGKEFLDRVNYFCQSWWPAKENVKQALEDRYNVHSSGRIIELKTFVPWKQHLFDLEKEMNIKDDIYFCIYSDRGEWRVICVPITHDSFICRNFLKEEWRGLNKEELIKASGIQGSVFCHHTGFIGGNQTREGVMEMAIKSF